MMQTAVYSRIGDLEIKVDFQAPPSVKEGVLPSIVFIHGGGMIAGCCQAATSAHRKGMVFLSADHRLIHPSTGLDIIEDMRTLFAFLSHPSFSTKHLPDGISLDPARLAVVEASGGGYAAMAAAISDAQPKPKAVFLLYAMGGDFLELCDHWIAEKGPTAHMGLRHLVDDGAVAHLIDRPLILDPIAECPLKQRPDGTFGGGHVGTLRWLIRFRSYQTAEPVLNQLGTDLGWIWAHPS
ncbi:uncharacterized protein B0H18DRAFT_957483 [Fomitopsis serialis]|uniref:uncharacterized protein n=1 Tax=Fomitopsis serialis TaxID=139415 RepID=UPI002007487B|nr:uncharacterized protein B0H18DRAFT_957483 [Neoantrodia serialis]KAH9919528.1 hypothetical protein B0H18DRAFT_957483 [Neoantrodia serialis]